MWCGQEIYQRFSFLLAHISYTKGLHCDISIKYIIYIDHIYFLYYSFFFLPILFFIIFNEFNHAIFIHVYNVLQSYSPHHPLLSPSPIPIGSFLNRPPLHLCHIFSYLLLHSHLRWVWHSKMLTVLTLWPKVWSVIAQCILILEQPRINHSSYPYSFQSILASVSTLLFPEI
jgi:hypothetical protein